MSKIVSNSMSAETVTANQIVDRSASRGRTRALLCGVALPALVLAGALMMAQPGFAQSIGAPAAWALANWRVTEPGVPAADMAERHGWRRWH